MEIPIGHYYYSDPFFTVYKVPSWRATLYTFMSVKLWGNIPSPLQRSISKVYSKTYDKPYSKLIIPFYLKFNYSDKEYLNKFKPPNKKESYESFQDFFTREFKEIPKNTNSYVWPCEGLLCHLGKIKEIPVSKVKYDKRSPATIFGLKASEIPSDYVFSNVFLHNKNYHRIHAPVDGVITRIQHVPGDLVVLRPWIYKQNPSLPAFRNERYNIDITDKQGQVWHLSIVGGPAVGTIELNSKIKLNSKVTKLEQLALFYLGSTCCMATPVAPCAHTQNTFVEVGATY